MPRVEQNKLKRSGIGLRACDHERAFPGFTLSSRANARDLRKISPGVYPELAEGVDDKAFLCAFARDISALVAARRARSLW